MGIPFTKGNRDGYNCCSISCCSVSINIHNVTEAKEFSDRIVGMRYGRIIFDDKPDMLDPSAMEAIYAGSPHADRSGGPDDKAAAS